MQPPSPGTPPSSPVSRRRDSGVWWRCCRLRKAASPRKIERRLRAPVLDGARLSLPSRPPSPKREARRPEAVRGEVASESAGLGVKAGVEPGVPPTSARSSEQVRRPCVRLDRRPGPSQRQQQHPHTHQAGQALPPGPIPSRCVAPASRPGGPSTMPIRASKRGDSSRAPCVAVWRVLSPAGTASQPWPCWWSSTTCTNMAFTWGQPRPWPGTGCTQSQASRPCMPRKCTSQAGMSSGIWRGLIPSKRDVVSNTAMLRSAQQAPVRAFFFGPCLQTF